MRFIILISFHLFNLIYGSATDNGKVVQSIVHNTGTVLFGYSQANDMYAQVVTTEKGGITRGITHPIQDTNANGKNIMEMDARFLRVPGSENPQDYLNDLIDELGLFKGESSPSLMSATSGKPPLSTVRERNRSPSPTRSSGASSRSSSPTRKSSKESDTPSRKKKIKAKFNAKKTSKGKGVKKTINESEKSD